MERSSTVVWKGSGKEGKGTVTSQSKLLKEVPYAWNTRFAEEKGTNPEELIAAALASCFTMKLSFLLSDAGYVPDKIKTTAAVTLDGSSLTQSHLTVEAEIPRISKEDFEKYAEKSKNECPVSKALKLEITMTVSLELPVEN
ncbi:MAG: OsmC family protein [Bacteroidia bacterium]